MKIEVSPENGADAAVLVSRGLEDAGRGRADADEAPAPAARVVQRLGRRRVDPALLRVHLVVARVVRFDRQEGAGADMQRHAMQRAPRAP